MNKKILILMIAAIASQADARKPLASGDIVGRDLLIPGAGWIGHVGLGTGDDVGLPTQIIIEVLNESPVVQLNNLTNFRARSRYWGSRSGLGDYSTGTYNALVEAYHQSWWCPTYSSSTAYVIGQGNPYTRQPTKCGMWRCDTFIAWDFYSAGFPQIMNNRIMLPLNVYNTFPYANGDTITKINNVEDKTPLIHDKDKQFFELSADELNNLSYEKFVELADIPLSEETPTHIAVEWEFAANKNVNSTKRGIFIDRLSISNEQDVISRFLEMYKRDSNPEIRSKLIQGIMIYYQNNREQTDNTLDDELLKQFYSGLLNQKLARNDADKVIRGYIDFHSPEEIMNHRVDVEKQMIGIEPRLELGLRHELAYKSKELEKIYITSIIKMLKKHQRSDLDGMFFGMTNIWFKNLKDGESIEKIKSYMKLSKKKYMNVRPGNEDLYADVARISFQELNKSLIL
ncbi:Uncharacterised protein [Legionella beliardensis]|uniref:Uncharacterized protein n=1 Tax=Legionella beliardensis TaxID=91822 RepID=A0A378I160_9GAMM|nr:hypothetical protein [Legionella beliardensis]STX28460.1 Uncharacterised protein [Legionella beliardensis]